MPEPASETRVRAVIPATALQALIDALAQTHTVIGPVLRDGAIIYDRIARTEDLPAGWTDRQEAGRYNVERRDDAALFGYNVGPHSWKKFLHPPRETLFTARREGSELTITPDESAGQERYAFLGVRACEVAAIARQDRIFMGGAYRDAGYAARRRNAFIVAVNCTEAGATCFCASMGTGPHVQAGFDLALTELLDDNRHDFLVQAGSPAGAALLATLPGRVTEGADLAASAAGKARAEAQMGRKLETKGLKEALQANPTHSRWDEVATRCLSCANCTMVCPTCFCTTVTDVSDLSGTEFTRERQWDSCFTLDFSYVHGGAVRQSGAARYRQWLTHKIASWIDQFGESGCVGCGRCITWCPVGIDLTVEAAIIAAGDAK
ncbi:MAG: 4Fe-4S dicluster domain-containing protein [Acidocella sp.]